MCGFKREKARGMIIFLLFKLFRRHLDGVSGCRIDGGLAHDLFLLLFMCSESADIYVFILLSTMNVDIVTVNTSGGDEDAVLLGDRAAFTSELHIMEQNQATT